MCTPSEVEVKKCRALNETPSQNCLSVLVTLDTHLRQYCLRTISALSTVEMCLHNIALCKFPLLFCPIRYILFLSGACHEDVATSTSRRHAGLSIAHRLAVRRQAKVERAQIIILNRSQPGLPRSSSSSSPAFGRTPNADPESTAQMTKE